MPNWTSNRLRIQTDSLSETEFKKIAELKEIFKSDSPFNKIIPQPDWLTIPNEDGELPIIKEYKNHLGEVDFTITEFPSSGKQDDRWYSWCNENWGTKWDACHVQITRDDKDYLEICFDTAWSPATPVIEKIRELYEDDEYWTQVTCLYELEGYEGCGYV
tara:strand:- start:872 stop:1351 length:480 start_codon:yes stop_codon:yes gene_type:complete